MLSELLSSVSALDAVKEKVGETLFRRSGWSIPDDTDTGISFGVAVDVGGGYMEMDLLDCRTTPNQKYEVRGAYVELGFGIGEISKLQGVVEKLVKLMPKKARPSSDFVFLPGGSMTQLIMGPKQTKQGLDTQDFNGAGWVYMHVGMEIAVVSGDVGLMFLVDANVLKTFEAVMGLWNPTQLLLSVVKECIAWTPYYGVSLGLGAGGKIAFRVIKSFTMSRAAG